ncbi:MAG: hypothetical protein HKP28_01810, partial [Winogradskyella sp.]|nr:hypothetical protein [Winogradskyella sp.]
MDYLLKASLLILIFYGFYKLFLQNETFFSHIRWFLLGGLILSLVIPLITIPIYVEALEPAAIISVPNNITQGITTTTSSSLNWGEILSWAYSLVALALLVKLVIEFVSLLTLLRTDPLITDESLKIVKTSKDTPPFSFFRTIVVNPEQFSDTDLDYILKHEEIHAKQWHSLDILLVKIITVLFWFNPIVWLYKKALVQNLEFIADDYATRKIDSKKDYQMLLLKASVPNQQFQLTTNFYNSLIKKRIIMLHKSKSQNVNTLKFVAILPVLALFLMSFSTEEIITYPEDTLNADVYNVISPLENSVVNDVIMITKDMTDADLEKITKTLSSKGIKAKFKGIKRNKSGEITAIKIDVSTSSSEANFNISTDDAIEPIAIKIDDDGHSISIGNSGKSSGANEFYFESDDDVIEIDPSSGNGKNIIIVKEVDDREEGDGNVKKEVRVKRLKTNKDKKNVKKQKNIIIEKDNDEDEDEDIEVIMLGDNDDKVIEKKIIIK